MRKTLYLFIIAISFSCSSTRNIGLIPTDNEGGYKISYFKGNEQNSNSVIVSGTIYNVKTGKPIIDGITKVEVGCFTYYVGADSKYTLEFEDVRDLTLNAKVVSVGYKTIIPKPIEIKNNSSIKLDFYLEVASGNLSSCEVFYTFPKGTEKEW